MAIVYPTFPRVGVAGELTTYARITRQDFTWRRNSIIDHFDDGMWEATRSRGSGKLVDKITDIYTLREDDYTTAIVFLDLVEFGTKPFWYLHPNIGTGLVKLATDLQSVVTAVQGNPTWFTFTLVLRGVSG